MGLGQDELDGKVALCMRRTKDVSPTLVGRFEPSELRILASFCGWDSKDVTWAFDPENARFWVEVKVYNHQERGG